MNDAINEKPSWDFDKEKEAYDSLISDWREEKDKVYARRKLRENKKNVDEERQLNRILKHQTIIPDRTIDLNIRRAKPFYVSYITNAKRNLIATDVEDPSRDTEPLELWFTRGMRYPGWKTPWLNDIDGMLTHGGCAMEVIYDPTKPFNCCVEYIPRERLIFNRKARDLQACPRILRDYKITTLQLREFCEQYDFKRDVVDSLDKDVTKKEDFLHIYKVYFKKDSIVYVCWYAPKAMAGKKWLKDPIPLDVGLIDFNPEEIKQVFQIPEWNQEMAPGMGTLADQFYKPLSLSEYPLFWFRFEETENEVLLEGQGRVALDLHVQEALTYLLTNTVNATTLASNFYPTAENSPGDDAQLGELGPLKPGIIMNRKITVQSFPWPSNIILAVTQILDQRKAQDSGNADFAAVARKDANKTAREMELATAQSQEQQSSQLSVFSTPVLGINSLTFNIARHQAIFGLCYSGTHPELLFGNYNLQQAGDIEVVKRNEDRENAKAFFELVRGTPAADKLLTFLLQRFFPDQADEWQEALGQGNKDELIRQMAAMLAAVPTDELNDQQRQGLQSILAAAQQMVGGPNDQAGNANTNRPQESKTPAGNAVQIHTGPAVNIGTPTRGKGN